MERQRVTPDLVRCLVDGQFPDWAGLPLRPVALDGWDNTTLRLGDALSVRLPNAAGYVAQIEKEHRWLPRLAAGLSMPIPDPVARGEAGCGYPFPWSVYRWLDGEPAATASIADEVAFARDLGGFLAALHRLDTTDGPAAGDHSFGRGGPLERYDAETRATIAALGGRIDGHAALRTWEAALDRPWSGPDVWAHGDLAASNLLVRDGRLAAVIDFGCCAVGDPACDTVMAWTFFSGASAAAFRAASNLDADTWARGRAWALWKTLITLHGHTDDQAALAETARRFGWRLDPAALIEHLVAAA